MKPIREVLSSACDPLDIVSVTHLHNEVEGETWQEFTQRMKEMFPGEEQQVVFVDGHFGLKFTALEKKSETKKKKVTPPVKWD